MNILQKIWYKDRGVGELPVNICWPSGDIEIQISRRIDLVFHFWTKNQKVFAFHKTFDINPKFTCNLPCEPESIYITEADLDTFIDSVKVNGIKVTASAVPVGAFKHVENYKYPRWKIIWRKIKRILRRY